jgi:hypothetical protein
MKTVAGVEIRFSSPVSSLISRGGGPSVRQFKTEYLFVFDDGSTKRDVRSLARASKIFNTAQFTSVIRDLLSEFARHAESLYSCDDSSNSVSS